ncbi:MAG TPA: nitrilase-related carbon-nitrogen hydrolase [Candidatus Acidoferrales bacterium]|nr:nitrilase-related carbon-nitrogen hydrolase [Candidatus Acidoferrales bacterium]
MESLQASKSPGWKKSMLWVALAAACFNAAYASLKYPAAGLFILGYAYFLVRLTDQGSVRRAFYFGLAAGYLSFAPQLFFMWNIFGPFAVMLWFVLAFWAGLFTAVICGATKRWGRARAAWLIPIVWTGVEYFRSELYYLKFSWMNVGYALPQGGLMFGMYGAGFVVLSAASLFSMRAWIKVTLIELLGITALIGILLAMSLSFLAETKSSRHSSVSITGIQLEFPPTGILPKVLDQALAKNTNAQIFVLSEYSLKEGVPDSLKNWCREHSRYLVVGGEEVVTNDVYYNTAFVVGTNGDIVFKQAKSVPIQFFRDGLAATNQALWDSPWGKIGICICYDLSYTRVTDELIRQGAQLLIVPTMDVETWGRHQHELHSRVAPVRAAEYGVPIFRLASSGISQAVTGSGHVIAQAAMPGPGETLSAQLRLPRKGSLPVDRFLAPVCTVLTALIIGWLLVLGWKRPVK